MKTNRGKEVIMMKKIKWLLLGVVFAFIFTQIPVFAEEVELVKDTGSNYIGQFGVVKEVQKDGNKVILTVSEEGKEGGDSLISHVFLTKDTLIYNTLGEKVDFASLQVGQKLEYYYDKNKPMIMIYPAQIYPEIVILPVKDRMGIVKVGKFDENFLSLDGELQLIISEETEILNHLGQKMEKEDLVGKELIVFYTVATKSFPPKTTPTKIIAYTVKMDKLKEINDVIGDDFYMEDGTKRIPLRKVAEFLDYNVEYIKESHGVKLTLGKNVIMIELDKMEYKENKNTGSFTKKPIVKDGTSYVSEEFIYVLLNH